MSAIASAAGGLVSGVTGLFAGQQQNQANQDEQTQSEAYDTQMSDTEYQRGVQDMRMAGLNPILAAASPDSAPTIANVPMVSPLAEGMQAGMSNFSALQSSRQTDATVSNTDAQTNLNQALTAKAAADTTSALSSAKLNSAQADKIQSGSLASDVVGSTAAAKGSQYLNSAIDNATSKIGDIIGSIRTNSAKALDSAKSWIMNHPFDTSGDTATGDDGDSIHIDAPPPN